MDIKLSDNSNFRVLDSSGNAIATINNDGTGTLDDLQEAIAGKIAFDLEIDIVQTGPGSGANDFHLGTGSAEKIKAKQTTRLAKVNIGATHYGVIAYYGTYVIYVFGPSMNYYEVFTLPSTFDDTTTFGKTQNKIITEYKSGDTNWDTTPTENSTKPVTSGGVYSALSTLQQAINNKIGFDMDIDCGHGPYIIPANTFNDSINTSNVPCIVRLLPSGSTKPFGMALVTRAAQNYNIIYLLQGNIYKKNGISYSSAYTLGDNGDALLKIDNTPTESSTNLVTSGGIYTALAAKQPTLVSGTNIKTINGESVLGSGNINTPLTETTWSALKTLRDSGQLVPGMKYRITDYECTTLQDGTSSAGHPFDIIVFALDESHLSEDAWAAHHQSNESGYVDYFANNNLDAWKLKYCLDNDTSRFFWADTTNGKGVIYRMVDEFSNDVPYDFKNIQFTDSAETPKYTNAYTFSYTENSVIKDASLVGGTQECFKNFIGEYRVNGVLQLNWTLFYSSGSGILRTYDNHIAENNHNNSFIGSQFRENTIGPSFYSNIISSEFSSNTIGPSFYSNTIDRFFSDNTIDSSFISNNIGSNFQNNIIGSRFRSNTLGTKAQYNTIGPNFQNNTIGSNFNFNSIDSNFMRNTIGSNCESNTIGSFFSNNTIGSSASDNVYVHYCKIDGGVMYISLTSADTTASVSNYIQYVHIHHGVKGASSSNRKTVSIPDRNLTYETNIVPIGTSFIEI